jgi:hypothetical protein
MAGFVDFYYPPKSISVLLDHSRGSAQAVEQPLRRGWHNCLANHFLGLAIRAELVDGNRVGIRRLCCLSMEYSRMPLWSAISYEKSHCRFEFSTSMQKHYCAVFLSCTDVREEWRSAGDVNNQEKIHKSILRPKSVRPAVTFLSDPAAADCRQLNAGESFIPPLTSFKLAFALSLLC